MQISCQFDAGNIEVIRAERPNDIQLAIRQDNAADYRQWFYFRLSGVRDQACHITINNLDKTSYPAAWDGYHPCVSYDREEWFRVTAWCDDKQLTFKLTPEYDDVYIAYFAPYSYERHLDLIAWAQQSPLCQVKRVCQTVDERDLDVLQIGEVDKAKKVLWMIARQHPGEAMAEWFIEGFLSRLLDVDDPVAKRVLAQAVYYVVPSMNPDGAVRGNLRTNAAGVDLNRAWAAPSPQQSPEVYYVQRLIQQTGVDAFLDIHGDEELPYNFADGCEGIPSYDKRHQALEAAFKTALLALSPDFQTDYGYPKDAPGQANLSLAAQAVGEAHRCLSFTIEMPFKDTANLPDLEYGWSPERCKLFGHDTLGAVYQVLANL